MKAYLSFLMGTAAAVMTFTAAQAAPMLVSPVHNVRSYADLLDPVNDPASVLIADELARPEQGTAQIDLVQYHHHHHHHHFYHHHHHHHHHHFHPGFGIMVDPGYGDCYIQKRVYIDEDGYRHVRRFRVCD